MIRLIETKNTWARDDPALLFVLCSALCLSALMWGLLFRMSTLTIIKTALLMILRDFLLVGILVATAVWLFSRFLLQPRQAVTHQTDAKLEWAYAFDVHINSFVPVFVHLYIIQFFVSPLVTREKWVCLWLGNSLYLAAFAQYTYVTYLGLNALPFLVRQQLALFPLIPLTVAYVASLVGFNIPRVVLATYFGSIP